MNATVVPSEVIQTGQQGPYAFVVKEDHTVEMRAVTVGRTVGRETVVTKGIAPGETVVTDGQLRLAPGFKVEIASDVPGGTGSKAGGGSQ
jgi:multidrug efflux system membrane fusion protein